MTDERIFKALSGISAKNGGSLLDNVCKDRIDNNANVLFVGLGGLGLKSLNEIKKYYLNHFEPSNVRFLAIDSDIHDMYKFNALYNGYGALNGSEMFELYDNTPKHILFNNSQLVRKYYGSDLPIFELDNFGARAIRGVGRVMLSATQKYEQLREVFKAIIEESNNNYNQSNLNVVIIAGISGGTGGGIFIDVSYMIRMLLDELSICGDLYGAFYTPDVQMYCPGICGDPVSLNQLRSNGYASLKELDYFMNLENTSDERPIYTIETACGTFSSKHAIFDKGKVFIINNACKENDSCDRIINSTAVSLLKMFSDTRSNSQNYYLYQHFYNRHWMDAWEFANVGHDRNNEYHYDISGNNNCTFPAFMNYNYSSYMTTSVYFPINEMAGYFANKALSVFIDDYKKITNEDIISIMRQLNISSVSEILQNVKCCLNINENAFRIEESSAEYPQRKGLWIFGKVSGLEYTISEATYRAELELRNLTGKCIDNIFNNVIDFLEHYWHDFGPMLGNAILADEFPSDLNCISTKGIIGYLVDIRNSLSDALEVAEFNLKEKKAELETDKNVLQGKVTSHDEEIVRFIDLCAQYSNAYFDVCFIKEYMPQLLSILIEKLVQYNREVLKPRVLVFKSFADTLKEDSDIFENCYLNNKQDKFATYNAFNLGNVLHENDLFKRMLEEISFDKADILSIKQQLWGLFDIRNQNFEQIIDSSFLCENLRNALRRATTPTVVNKLEKYIMLIYGEKDALISANGGCEHFDIQSLDKLWENQELRDSALCNAAKAIVKIITENVSIAFDKSFSLTDLVEFNKITLLRETPNLNLKIQSELQTYGDVSYQLKSLMMCGSEMSFHKCNAPFSLQMLQNIPEYAFAYYNYGRAVAFAKGRHLDEVTERWQEYMPEIYGVDAENYYVNNLQRGERYRIPEDVREYADIRRYERIKEAVDFGIDKGYIDANTGKMIVLSEKMQTEEVLTEIKNQVFLLDQTDKSKKHSWVEAAAILQTENACQYCEEIDLGSAIKNQPLLDRIGAPSDNCYGIRNIYRIVGGNMESFRMVEKAKMIFEKYV